MTSAPVRFGTEGFRGVIAQDFPFVTLHPLALGRGGDEVIVTIGLEDLVIVREGKVTLIARKDQVARLKEVLRDMAALGEEL
ncbi:hypothetical protein TJA_25080 [Thermus sp. LT1-2-5]|uniref:hypothetical protein n=1 Tax=Thermus sp. LT1-2-5 TaxID=3026935 RepID=UPI0030E9EA5C